MGNQLTAFLILFTLAFFSFKNVFAQEENNGCPDNSYCTPELGAIYLQWKEALTRYSSTKSLSSITDFHLTKGLPLVFWNDGKPSDKNFISWKSHYKLHLKTNFHLVTLFVKNTSNLPLGTAFGDTILVSKEGKVISYNVPQGEHPLAMDGDDLLFSMEEDGIYYTISLSFDGNIKLAVPVTPPEFPETTDCPKELLDGVKAIPNKKGLYQDTLCKRIVDLRTKRSFIYIVKTPDRL